jgi:hypothetical protein
MADTIDPNQTISMYINQQLITSSIVQSAHQACLKQDLMLYFKQRYNWNDTTIDDIDWIIHNKALQRTKTIQDTFNQKFIHNWLPVNGHPASEFSSPLCQRCLATTKTQDHWFICKHYKAVQESIQHAATIERFNKQIGLHHDLNVLVLAIFTQNITPQLYQNTPHLKHIFKKQERIGWTHFLRMCISKEWAKIQE